MSTARSPEAAARAFHRAFARAIGCVSVQRPAPPPNRIDRDSLVAMGTPEPLLLRVRNSGRNELLLDMQVLVSVDEVALRNWRTRMGMYEFRALITEFGVAPIRNDWRDVLNRSDSAAVSGS